MEPREVASEAAGEAAEECSSLQATIGSLPEGTLAHALGFLTLRERQQAARACRRCAALCSSPALLREVELAATADAAALGSFAAWLERHGRHVRRLAIPNLEHICFGRDDAEAVARDYERCLQAAGAAGQLEELVFNEETGLLDGVDWPSAVPSLRRLHLDSGLLCIPPSLPTLTALCSLELRGGVVQPLQGHDGRLPSGLTRLGVTRLYANFLPRQLSPLRQLQRLQLNIPRYPDHGLSSLSVLAGSLTRFETYEMPLDAAGLAALTQLQHLECHGIADGSCPAVASALPHLTSLTCLVLSDEDLDTLLPALSGLSSLQLCSLWRLAGSAEAAPLPSGPWLHSVRCLAAGAGTLLSSAAALRGASALQSLAILHAAPLECDWCSSDADALLECLARHPALRRVYLHATLHQSLSEAGHMVGWACR